MSRLAVAVVVTRLQAGAGGVALRGALAVDPERYDVTIIAGGTDGAADADGSGDRLLGHAADAGLRVVQRARARLADIAAPGHPGAAPAHRASAGRGLRRGAHAQRQGRRPRPAGGGAGGTPRVVHTFHGFPFHEFQSRGRRAGYVAIERYLGRRTDVFLAVGGAVAAEAVRRGIAAPDRVRVINPAISWPAEPVRPGRPGRARRRLAVPVGCSVVGTVGRVDYQKAPESFVDALAALDRPDVYAVWIGDGPLRRDMERRVDRRGLRDRFRCVGHRDDVPGLLPGLDVFVMASRYEGLPCAVAEAMTAGLPVVATAVNAVPDVVLPGETGLLASPEQPQQLAAAIRYMLDEPTEAARMAAAGQRLIGDRFTPDALGTVLDAAYRSGPSRPPRPRRYVPVARTA